MVIFTTALVIRPFISIFIAYLNVFVQASGAVLSY